MMMKMMMMMMMVVVMMMMMTTMMMMMWVMINTMMMVTPRTCSAQAKSTGCKADQDIYMIVVVDLNVPGAKNSETLNELCSCIQFCNDLAPTRTICMLELPETAKKTSKRGLADEEAEVQTALWSLRQSCDCRWVCPFRVHPTADAQTNRRQGMQCINQQH